MFGKVVGGIMGTVAFSVACIVGLIAGNDATTVLSRGLMALLIFFVIGFGIGLMARKLIDEHMQRVVDADRQQQASETPEPRGEQDAADADRPESHDAAAPARRAVTEN